MARGKFTDIGRALFGQALNGRGGQIVKELEDMLRLPDGEYQEIYGRDVLVALDDAGLIEEGSYSSTPWAPLRLNAYSLSAKGLNFCKSGTYRYWKSRVKRTQQEKIEAAGSV